VNACRRHVPSSCNDYPSPRGHDIVSLEVGLLTHCRIVRSQPSHLLRPELASANNGSILRKERRLRSVKIASSIQRPDRPGISPEFPVCFVGLQRNSPRANEDYPRSLRCQCHPKTFQRPLHTPITRSFVHLRIPTTVGACESLRKCHGSIKLL
jgi:hypothetical protein